MKSAKLEWCLKDLTAAEELISQGLKMYSDSPKLWMMAGQIKEQTGDVELARKFYSDGVR